MKRDVHLQALKAAARVAFSVGSFAVLGCGGATSESPTSGSPAPEGAATATDPGKTSETDKTTPPNREPEPNNPPTTPTTPTTPSTPAKGCEKVIAEAFPTEGQYPGVKQNVSAEVTSCCEKMLLEPDPQGTGAHRWDCCANVDTKNNKDLMLACTPWGPPVPPKMIARKRRMTDRLVA